MRTSSDQYRNGKLWNGYDYDIQVWVKGGIVQDCLHPDNSEHAVPCCKAHTYRGQQIATVRAFLGVE